MGNTLTGEIVADTYDSLLKVTDNNVITGTKKRLTDGFGNDTPLLVSTTDIQIDGNFLTESAQFNTATAQTADTPGKVAWNDQDGTLDLRLKGNNVTLQIGQEQLVRVVNKTGASLNESAYQAVRVSTAQGQRLGVQLAQANNDANSAETIGIVTETIANNEEGFITTSGLVRGINTTGSLQGETWADGDMLYLSGTTAGAITKVKPSAPIHTVIIGYVVYAHATQGKIYVKVDNGYELDELHNVLITSPSNNQVLAYDSTTGLWKNTTNGNATISATTNYVLKATGSNSAGNSVIYDDGSNIGLGTTSPAYKLDIVGIQRTNGYLIGWDGTSVKYLFTNDGGDSYINSGKFLINSASDNGSGAILQVNGGITSLVQFNNEVASYTLVLSDAGKLIEMNVGSANNLTIPLNSSVAFPIGTQIDVVQQGSGQTTIQATGGVTLRSSGGKLKLYGQYSACSLIKRDTDEWYVIGDLTT